MNEIKNDWEVKVEKKYTGNYFNKFFYKISKKYINLLFRYMERNNIRDNLLFKVLTLKVEIGLKHKSWFFIGSI